MNLKPICASLLAMFAITTANAGNVNATAARAAANSFLKQHAATTSGMFKAPALSDIKLAHAEPSSKIAGANDYYAFNITGGGFIIIAGEDRAVQVLGYSDKGHIDFNNLPDPLKDLLDDYKNEIEFLQTYKGNDLIPAPASFKASGTVGPFIKTEWGQEMPYCLQCPIYQGEYCVVGCVATAMAQVMKYWQYPTSSNSIKSYRSYRTNQTIPSLPATTFDYSLMLDSYCHWNWEDSALVQDTYTDEQAQAVAKLSRYCGQAVQMGYSPEGSGAYTSDQLSAMKTFGYSNAALVSKGGNGGWWSSGYTTEQWENLLKTDLDAGRPILYSANDPQPNGGGHAFICDGYNSSGYFHFNLGWFGTCNGWYKTTALQMLHRDSTYLNFSNDHQIVYKLEPPTYCIVEAESLNTGNELIILGGAFNVEAQNVTFRTSYSNFNLAFALTDANDNRVVTGDAINISKTAFVQGSNVTGTLTLPSTLQQGTYNVQLDYYTNANALNTVIRADGQLVVVGHIAKCNSDFDVEDVAKVINYVLGGHPDGIELDIDDVTLLINHILNK